MVIYRAEQREEPNKFIFFQRYLQPLYFSCSLRSKTSPPPLRASRLLRSLFLSRAYFRKATNSLT